MHTDHNNAVFSNKDFSGISPLLEKADAFWFDLDGTLADNEGPALDLIRDVISGHVKTQFGLAGIATCYRHLSGSSIDDIMAVAERETGKTFSPEMKSTIKNDISEQRKNALSSEDKIEAIRALAELAQYIKNTGMPFCVVTASEPLRAEHSIKAAGLDDIFGGDSSTWLFASNLQSKMDTHVKARQTLSKIHGFDIDPARWVGFEDSPNAIKQAVAAHAVVIPHTLCSHISPEHVPARVQTLREAKLDALRANNLVEFTRASNGLLVPVQTPGDILVVRTGKDLVPVLAATLDCLPARHDQPGSTMPTRRQAVSHNL